MMIPRTKRPRMQLTTIRIIIILLEIPGGLVVMTGSVVITGVGLLVAVTTTTGPMDGLLGAGAEVGRVMTRGGSGVRITGRSRCELGFTIGFGVSSG